MLKQELEGIGSYTEGGYGPQATEKFASLCNIQACNVLLFFSENKTFTPKYRFINFVYT